ncbi:MAG: M48 family metallopeptidase [Cryomorphaceae bacterium]|nr:M48 family metallopeptidase [Cryomorphaceae bacterium]
MRYLYFTLIFVLCGLSFSYAQRTDYEPLRATGPIPQDFTNFFTTKYMEASLSVDVSADKKTRKRQDVFHKNNQFFLDELLTSGSIIYGDPVTNYVQQVMDYLLEVYGQTNKDIRVYTVRSTQFNAAATEDGILLVNLGLLAQVENEAQLAFILSHELIHTEENHVIDGFLEKMKIEKGESAYRRQSGDDKLIAMSNYSKSHEFEADLEGYKRIFAKTNYDPEEALRVLDVMLYSYLPFDEVEMDKTFFNSNHFVLDSNLFPETVKSITAYEDYDDSKSTHPNLKARREALEDVIEKNPSSGKEWYIINEKAFKEAQEMARFENSALHLANREYAEAIYNSFLLLNKHPDNKYLRKNIGVALHTFATYKNNEKTRFVPDVNDIEGNLQSMYYLLEKIDAKGLSILSTQYNYENYRLFPNDPFLERMFHKSLRELVFFHEVNNDDFETEFPQIEEEVEEEVEEDTRRRNSKVSKLSKTKRSIEDIHAYALVNLFKEETFKSAWDDMQKELSSFKSSDNYLSWYNRRVKGRSLNILNAKEPKKDPIEKVVVVTPRYLMLKQGNFLNNYKPIIKFEETDMELRKMREIIPEYIESVGLEASFLDYKKLDKMEDDMFNDLMFVNDWLNEYWKHPRVENMVSRSDQVEAFIEKYDTQYILYTGLITYKKTRDITYDLMFGLIGAAVFPPFILFSGASLIKPYGEVYQFVTIYDIKNGYTRFHFVENFEDRISDAQLKAMIYDKLYRVAND